MHTNTHCRRQLRLPVFFLIIICFSQCRVYTINKSDLENELRPKGNEVKGMSMNALYKKTFKNSIDTLPCANESGQVKIKRFTHDSKITIITSKNKAIKYYAKTLYIYKDEFLIGERTAPRLRGPNYFPVKLSDISRIEVLGF